MASSKLHLLSRWMEFVWVCVANGISPANYELPFQPASFSRSVCQFSVLSSLDDPIIHPFSSWNIRWFSFCPFSSYSDSDLVAFYYIFWCLFRQILCIFGPFWIIELFQCFTWIGLYMIFVFRFSSNFTILEETFYT